MPRSINQKLDREFSSAVTNKELDRVCNLIEGDERASISFSTLVTAFEPISSDADAGAGATGGAAAAATTPNENNVITLLHIAVEQNNPEAINTLCDKALDLAKRSQPRYIEANYTRCIDFLFATDHNNLTAMDLIVQNLDSRSKYWKFPLAKALAEHIQALLQSILGLPDRNPFTDYNLRPELIRKLAEKLMRNSDNDKHWLILLRNNFKENIEIKNIINNLLRHILPNIKTFTHCEEQNNFIIMLYLKLFDALEGDVKDLLYLCQHKLFKELATRKPSELISRDLRETTCYGQTDKPQYRSTRTIKAEKPIQLSYSRKNPAETGALLIPAEAIHRQLTNAHDREHEFFPMSTRNIVTAAITFILSTADTDAGHRKTRKAVTLYIKGQDIFSGEWNYTYQLWLAYRIFDSFDKDAVNTFLTKFQEEDLNQQSTNIGELTKIRYYHSEMALAYYLTRSDNIQALVQTLKARDDIIGTEKVMAVILDLHSTNMPCSNQCRRVLHSLLRDNHDPKGFLSQLQKELYASGKGFRLPKRFEDTFIGTHTDPTKDRLRAMLRCSYKELHGSEDEDDALGSDIDCLEVNRPTHEERVITFTFGASAESAGAASATADASASAGAGGAAASDVPTPPITEAPCTFFYSGNLANEPNFLENRSRKMAAERAGKEAAATTAPQKNNKREFEPEVTPTDPTSGSASTDHSVSGAPAAAVGQAAAKPSNPKRPRL